MIGTDFISDYQCYQCHQRAIKKSVFDSHIIKTIIPCQH
jgi:hypothetical protein